LTPSNLQEFLEQFFGEGNAIRWNQYLSSRSTDPMRVQLEPWITLFQKQHGPYCLPRVDTVTQQTTWYVLCTDPREARAIRETLQAFIGPTYADFNGEFATLSTSDPIEKVCYQYFGQLAFRLKILNPKVRARINALLSRMIEFRDRDSVRSASTVRPIGRLFRDVEMAIITGNEESANRICAEIRSRGRLSATNLAFLQVHILAAFNRWTDILCLPNLSDLLQVRRPKRVSEHLSTAIYQQFFYQYEEMNDARAAIAVFKSAAQRYQGLLRSTESLLSAGAIKFAVLAATATSPPNRHLAEQLMKSQVSDADRPWCEAIISQLDPTAPTESPADNIALFDLAEMRYSEGNLDEAFALYLEAQPNYRSVCRVLETAVEIDTNTAATRALRFLQSASDDVRGKINLRRVCSHQIEILTSIIGQPATAENKPIESLTEWFQCVDRCNYSANMIRVLEYNCTAWLSDSKLNAATVSDLLRKSRTSAAAETVRNAVPIFIRALLVDNPVSREHKPIYSALIDLIVYDEMVGFDDLYAVEQLFEGILTFAPSHDLGNSDFSLAVEVTKYLWETLAAPRHLDWALSMLDLLVDTGAHQHVDLCPVLTAIANSCRAWIRRVSDNQWSMLALLGADLGLGALLDGIRPSATAIPAESDSIRCALQGKTVAVYSLTERIARRFGQLAEQAFDGIRIHYLHDKVLTDRMKRVANSSDIIIVNTWDAKHAATAGIKRHCSERTILLEPNGKTATSLFNTLESFVCAMGQHHP